jgi:hypothetical protein
MKIKIMKKIAQRLGVFLFVIAITPVAALIKFILTPFALDVSMIVSIKFLFLVIQLFGLFLLIRYRNDIF